MTEFSQVVEYHLNWEGILAVLEQCSKFELRNGTYSINLIGVKKKLNNLFPNPILHRRDTV